MGFLQSAQDNRQSVDQRGSERFDKGCTRLDCSRGAARGCSVKVSMHMTEQLRLSLRLEACNRYKMEVLRRCLNQTLGSPRTISK